MGGYAGVKIAFTRPDLFGFVGAFSPPIEVVHRHFNIRRTAEWWRLRRIFGPWGSESRRSRDPFALVRNADLARTPYIYLTMGQNEPLLEPNKRFASQLRKFHFAYESHILPGGHDWNEWNSQIPGCFQSLSQHLGFPAGQLHR
jgi:putative tributyrin esterase